MSGTVPWLWLVMRWTVFRPDNNPNGWLGAQNQWPTYVSEWDTSSPIGEFVFMDYRKGCDWRVHAFWPWHLRFLLCASPLKPIMKVLLSIIFVGLPNRASFVVDWALKQMIYLSMGLPEPLLLDKYWIPQALGKIAINPIGCYPQ